MGKLFALLIAGSLALLLSACGQDQNKGNGTNGDAPSAQVQADDISMGNNAATEDASEASNASGSSDVASGDEGSGDEGLGDEGAENLDQDSESNPQAPLEPPVIDANAH